MYEIISTPALWIKLENHCYSEKKNINEIFTGLKKVLFLQ